MFEYTKENHFKFGYNGRHEFQPRQIDTDQFTFEYGKTSNINLTWRESNELAARQIYSNKVGQIYILLSGGMDSEICLKSFVDQRIPVRTISLRFLDINQTEELSFIYKALDKFNIAKHEFIDVEVKSLINSKEFFSISDPIRCVSPIIVLHLWLANQVSGTPVIAQGEVHLKKHISSDYVPGKSPYEASEWYITESERLCAIYMNFILRKKPAIPAFFQYNVEQIYSYLTKNPILNDLVNNKIIGKLGTRSSKNQISKQFYTDIEMREKRHGWEDIQNFHDQIRSQLAKRYPYSDQSAEIDLSKLLKMISVQNKD